jgi:hypothetical protein
MKVQANKRSFCIIKTEKSNSRLCPLKKAEQNVLQAENAVKIKQT